MKSKKPPGTLPGITKTCFQLPKPLLERYHALRDARHRTEGSDVKLCRLMVEALVYYAEVLDPATGRPKPREVLAGADLLTDYDQVLKLHGA